MIGRPWNPWSCRMALVVWWPSIPGIITSIRTRSIPGSCSSRSIPARPSGAYSARMPRSSSALVMAYTLRTSSSTISTRLPARPPSPPPARRSLAGTWLSKPNQEPSPSPDEPAAESAWPAVLWAGEASISEGMNRVNTLPRFGSLSTWSSPPSRRAISRLIERPRPVPPYLRLVVPSACWNASKISSTLSLEMPMPVSATDRAITCGASRSRGLANRAPGKLDLGVLDLDRLVLPGELARLLLQLLVGALELLLLVLQLAGLRLQLLGQALRLLQQLLGAHRGDDGLVDRREGAERRQLDDRQHLLLERHRKGHDAPRRRLAQPGADGDVAVGQVGHQDGLALQRGLADQALADAEGGGAVLARRQAVAGQQLVPGLAERVRLGDVEGAVLRLDQRRQLGHEQPRDRLQVPVTLEHRADAGQVGLEPVLLLVLAGGLAQVGDHLVDVVLELADLAGGVDRDRPGEVALGHRRGHLGDGADLGGQVAGELVHVLGEPLPGAGHALDLGLAAQLALGAHLARDPGHLRREGGELVDHPVAGVLQLEDLAARVDGDLLRQVALGHRGGHLGDVADLGGQVAGKLVDVVGEVLPGAGHALDVGLAAELALGAHLARHPRHLVGERAELVDHGVDDLADVLELALHRAALDR